MQDKVVISKIHTRAKQVRKIAEGLFDQKERRVLLQFVDECEKLIAPDREKTRSSDL